MLFWSILISFPMQLLAQNRDPAPAVPPVGNASSAVSTTTAPPYVTETTTVNTNSEPQQLPARPIALRIVGSTVKNLKGEYLGLIEQVVLNPESKQIEFALLNTDYPTNTLKVTPVPWNHLAYVWDQSQVGGLPGAVQLFRLDVDKARLAQAPKIDQTQLAMLMMPPFRQQLIAFYGNGTENIGATGTETASTSGSASGNAATSNAGPGYTEPAYAYGSYGGYPGFIFAGSGTNDLITGILVTNANGIIVTNFVTNIVTGTNIVSVTNFVRDGRTNHTRDFTNAFTGTNIFHGTNIARGGDRTNHMRDFTNMFTGSNIVAGRQGTNVSGSRRAPFPPNPTNSNQGTLTSVNGMPVPTNGSAFAGGTNQFFSPTGRRPLDASGSTTAGTTPAQTVPSTAVPAQPRGNVQGSPWVPPTTIILPGSALPGAQPPTSPLVLPPPPGQLQLPNPVGPLPFPNPPSQGTQPPVTSPPGAIPSPSGATTGAR